MSTLLDTAATALPALLVFAWLRARSEFIKTGAFWLVALALPLATNFVAAQALGEPNRFLSAGFWIGIVVVVVIMSGLSRVRM